MYIFLGTSRIFTILFSNFPQDITPQHIFYVLIT